MANKPDNKSLIQDGPFTDEYILGPLACALTEADIELSDLASCLEVPLDQLSDSGTKKDKVVLLIKSWVGRYGVERSKNKLLSCLHGLKNAAAFKNALTKHDSETQGSETPHEGVMIDVEQASANSPGKKDTVPTNEDLESSSQVSEGDCFAQHLPMAEQGRVQQMIVTGLSTHHVDFRTEPKLFTSAAVTQRVANLEESFADLQSEISGQLQCLSQENINKIRVFLTSLAVGIEEDTSPGVFTAQQAEIISSSTLTQIFQWLTINRFWSFLNFYLLERLANKYCDDQMKANVKAFQDEMKKFKSETKLAEFLPAWSGRCPHIPASGFTPIILRVSKDWGDCTLADVARMEGFIESRFLINRFLLRFANGVSGSVWIMWLVPSHAVTFLREKMTKIDSKLLIEERITEVVLGQTSVMRVSSLPLPTHVGKVASSLPSIKHKSLLDQGNYEQLYATSVKNPDFFWGMLANEFLHWDVPFNTVMDCKMETGEIKWFTNGKINVSVNCVDRHASLYPDRVALIWEKDEPGQDEKVTYRELLQNVCQIANTLKRKGVKKGDLVAIYMPICPLAVASMLACARIGAVHSVLFSRFALIRQTEQRDNVLKERINGAKVVITANTSPLNGESLKLKESLDNVLESLPVQHVLVFKRTADEVTMKTGRDEWLEEAMANEPTECQPEPLESEDELFVMYTSGSTGKANGVVHTQAGYLLYTAVTHKYFFDYKPGEIFACDADIGWITGHSYVVYGPLCNGATTVLFDSTALYPKPSRYWELVEKHGISHFYTSPHVIQTLKSLDKDIPSSFNMASLKIIASVGDCLHAETKEWFHQRFGQGRCPLIDTWWQTEIGGIAISPDPRENGGKSMKPSFGVVPCLIDEEKPQVELSDCEVQGHLYLAAPLPGMGRRLTGADGKKNFGEYYFKRLVGKSLFDTYDIAHRDKNGDYEIYGRADDVIRYHGELLNLPKIEGAAKASHESIEEAYVVSGPMLETQLSMPVVVHLRVRDTSPDTKREVVSNVQESIKRTAEIKEDNVGFIFYEDDELSHHRTFSGKPTRHTLRNTEEEVEYYVDLQEEALNDANHCRVRWLQYAF